MKKAIVSLLAAACMMSAVPGPMAEGAAAETSERITINLASRILTLYQNGRKAYMYHICAGKLETPTPVGSFSISEKEVNPEWIDPKDHKKRVEPGEGNPLGMRWMGLFDMYGIHGTNNPSSIGGYYSNGCIRMNEDDIEQLYPKVDIGTKVDIYYNRLVIESLDDGTVVYYVYPDGYGRQPLDVAAVRKALDEYGVGSFQTNAEIAEKIDEADGGPTFLPRAFRIEIDNRWLSARAIILDKDELYVPVQSLSNVTKQKYVWDMTTQVVSTQAGSAPGMSVGNVLYVNFEDAKTLFGLTGDFDAERTLKLYTKSASAGSVPAEQANAAEPAAAAAPATAVNTAAPADNISDAEVIEAATPGKVTVQGKTK